MYSTPELLLVGAAQHLVLGRSELELGTRICDGDTDDPGEVNQTYFDLPAW